MRPHLWAASLDFMVDGIKRLEKKIAGVDKEKLDVYLDGFSAPLVVDDSHFGRTGTG